MSDSSARKVNAAARNLINLMKVMDAAVKGWYPLRYESLGGKSKISSWATEEAAARIATNQDKPSRVTKLANGRFAVEVYFE